MKMTVAFWLSTLVILLSSCEATPHAPVLAERCFLVEGFRDRYLEVDSTARELAKSMNLTVEGENSSALVIKESFGSGEIVISSPFGSDASIISFFNPDKTSTRLANFIDELLIKLQGLNLHPVTCDSIPGLSRPTIYGD